MKVSGAGAGCVHVVLVLTKCVCMCVLVARPSELAGIGPAGGTAVAEALKVNTSVQEIDLCGEGCWRNLPSVHACGSSEAYQVCVYLYACVVCVFRQ